MDVSSPINSVVPSLDGAVYSVLSGTIAPLPLSRVHRLAGRGSKAGIRQVLLRMVAHGLVLEVPGGYLLNRDHVAAPVVEQLSALRRELLGRIAAQVDGWPARPSLVGIFGSAARRDGDHASDIDLLVVCDDAGATDWSADLAAAVQRWTGNNAHVVTLGTDDLRRLARAREPIVATWRLELEVVCGSVDTLAAA